MGSGALALSRRRPRLQVAVGLAAAAAHPLATSASAPVRRVSLIPQLVKNLPAMQETPETLVPYLGREDPLEKG